jgi:methionine aminopeptidase
LLPLSQIFDGVSSNYSQENNYGIEKPGFKSVAYLTGHQIGGATHKWNYMFSASNTSTELDANVIQFTKSITFKKQSILIKFSF